MTIWNSALSINPPEPTNTWTIKAGFSPPARSASFPYVLAASRPNLLPTLSTPAWTPSWNKWALQVSPSLHLTLRSAYTTFTLAAQRAPPSRPQMQPCNAPLLYRDLRQKRTRRLLLRHSRSPRQWARLRPCRWCTPFYLIVFTRGWVMSPL